jgi:hypothetical protein
VNFLISNFNTFSQFHLITCFLPHAFPIKSIESSLKNPFKIKYLISNEGEFPFNHNAINWAFGLKGMTATWERVAEGYLNYESFWRYFVTLEVFECLLISGESSSSFTDKSLLLFCICSNSDWTQARNIWCGDQNLSNLLSIISWIITCTQHISTSFQITKSTENVYKLSSV